MRATLLVCMLKMHVLARNSPVRSPIKVPTMTLNIASNFVFGHRLPMFAGSFAAAHDVVAASADSRGTRSVGPCSFKVQGPRRTFPCVFLVARFMFAFYAGGPGGAPGGKKFDLVVAAYSLSHLPTHASR